MVVLAGFMRIVGPRVLAAFPGRILNTHPSLLPAFPGAHAVRDALAHGVEVTGATVHLVDETLDGGPIVPRRRSRSWPTTTRTWLHERIRAVEHRLLPRAAALLLAGRGLAPDGRRVDARRCAGRRARPAPRRALLSVSDKTGLVELRAGPRRWSASSSSRPAAPPARCATPGLPVTDVAAVTGFPEMLDGRVKTLHPRVHAGILADRRRPEHRAARSSPPAIAPFELVVVNLYPFAAAAERPGITFDELIEEIDIGGPSMVRAAAKNHASVAIVTSPARYAAVLDALDGQGGVPAGLRAALAVEAFRHTAAYDARIAAELPGRMAAAGVELPRRAGPAGRRATPTRTG